MSKASANKLEDSENLQHQDGLQVHQHSGQTADHDRPGVIYYKITCDCGDFYIGEMKKLDHYDEWTQVHQKTSNLW